MLKNVRAGSRNSHDIGLRFPALGKRRLQASLRVVPGQPVSSEGTSWNTRLIIVSERSRFSRIYSCFESPSCLMVMSRNMQGDDVLQHQARLPKQVWFPFLRGVSRTVSSFNRMYSSFGRCIRESVGIRGHSLTGMQQNARARISPPLHSCLGELYHPSSMAYRVIAASRPESVRISDFRARDTMSAPCESISRILSKVFMELFAISTSGQLLRIWRSFGAPKSIRSI